MAWPDTGDFSTINLDGPTDDPSAARADLYGMAQDVQAMIAAAGQPDGVATLD